MAASIEVITGLIESKVKCEICDSFMYLAEIGAELSSFHAKETILDCLKCGCMKSHMVHDDKFLINVTIGWRVFSYDWDKEGYSIIRTREMEQAEFTKAFKSIFVQLRGMPSIVVADWLEDRADNGYWLSEAARIRREELGMNVIYDMSTNRIIEKSP